MTPALIAAILAVAVTVAVLYPRHAEDRRDADWAWRVIDIARDRTRRTNERLLMAKARPAYLPEPTRAGGRFVAKPPDRARLTASLAQWRADLTRERGEQ